MDDKLGKIYLTTVWRSKICTETQLSYIYLVCIEPFICFFEFLNWSKLQWTLKCCLRFSNKNDRRSSIKTLEYFGKERCELMWSWVLNVSLLRLFEIVMNCNNRLKFPYEKVVIRKQKILWRFTLTWCCVKWIFVIVYFNLEHAPTGIFDGTSISNMLE